jgi:hypothetical protein
MLATKQPLETPISTIYIYMQDPINPTLITSAASATVAMTAVLEISTLLGDMTIPLAAFAAFALDVSLGFAWFLRLVYVWIGSAPAALGAEVVAVLRASWETDEGMGGLVIDKQ